MCQYISGPFSGWSIRGNYLVSPDGDRMTPERIAGVAGFASRRKAEAGQRRAGQRQMVKVVVVDLMTVTASQAELCGASRCYARLRARTIKARALSARPIRPRLSPTSRHWRNWQYLGRSCRGTHWRVDRGPRPGSG